MTRIVVDPITRIEGHLRIDCEVEGGKVSKAWSSGQMWRGIEIILKGRDPREAWVFTQRICGVCTTVHAIASVRAVENALALDVPLNVQYIRNLIVAAHSVHDHIVHFYHLAALDWVDIVSVLKGDPAGANKIGASLSTNLPVDTKGTKFAMPGGYIKAADLTSFKTVERFGDSYFRDGVQESVKHAWCAYSGDGRALHPFKGETAPGAMATSRMDHSLWVR